MSKEKKAKKARTPNIPMYTGPVEQQTIPTRGSGGGGGTTGISSPASASNVTVRTPGRTEVIQADYTHVVSDLKRIGLLAGSLIVVIVALSFFIK